MEYYREVGGSEFVPSQKTVSDDFVGARLKLVVIELLVGEREDVWVTSPVLDEFHDTIKEGAS